MRFVSIKSAVLHRAIATSALTTLAMFGAGQAHAQSALPSGGTVTSGTATISGGGSSVSVDQSSARAIINWSSFDVGAGNAVVFRQPDAQSATLNRVTGGTGSIIAGQITSNGAVYLINPNGIAITSTGSVQTGGGFVASTLDIADGDFNAGKLSFSGRTTGASVSNAGSITAGAGGYVALLGGQVSNSGLISVPLGTVALGAGEAITLDLNGDGFLQVAVPSALVAGGTAGGERVAMRVGTVRDAVRSVVNVPGNYVAESAIGSDGAIVLGGKPVENIGVPVASGSGASIVNSGEIRAGGGHVALTSTGTLSHTGAISADSASGDGGRIVLLGDNVVANGTLSARASGASGNGGFVETSGNAVDYTGLRVDTRAVGGATGTWLIDPVDLTVDAAAAATISTNLASSNVTLQTTSTTASGPGTQSSGPGDITINSAISWSGLETLQLRAYNNINLNAAISAPRGTLQLQTGNAVAFTGSITPTAAIDVGFFYLLNGAWVQNSATLPTFSATKFQIGTGSFLRAIGGNGASDTPYRITDVYGLQGIGSAPLLASNFTLANNIDASGTAAWGSQGWIAIGTNTSPFIGTFDGANFVINGLTIVASFANDQGLFGYVSGGTIRNVGLTSVSITATNNNVGAIVGNLATSQSTVSNVYSTGSVMGVGAVGGVVGLNAAGTVSSSWSSATVNGNSRLGGLIGQSGGPVSNSYATGAVTATTGSAGGLIGTSTSSITNAYATGAVRGGNFLGGLIGSHSAGSVSNVYATGSVSGTSTSIGGLFGQLSNARLSYAYATGAVSTTTAVSASNVGGLIGTSLGSTAVITSVYATGAVSSQGGTVGGLIGNLSTSGQSVSNAYATGFVTGTTTVGGLIGNTGSGTTISNVYATGFLTGTASVGPLIGNHLGSLSNAYWDSYSTGRTASAVGGGAGSLTNVSAVTSDPGQSTASNYAFKQTAYSNFAAATGIGTTSASGFIFTAGGYNGAATTRPFLAFEAPVAGNPGVITNGANQIVLVNAHQLQLVNGYAIGYNLQAQTTTLAQSYVLGNNIDLSETGQSPGYNAMWNEQGFVPIGTDGKGNVAYNGGSYDTLASIALIAPNAARGFSGSFDGGGYTLSGLSIYRPQTKNVGLFGVAQGSISNVTVGGVVSGLNGVGGLVGQLYNGGTVTGSRSSADALGNNLVGGLVGNASDGSTITRSSASGTVFGANDVGGLIGYASGATIGQSYATGAVLGTSYAGGLVGYQYNGTTSNSYATGSVNASYAAAGGLIGYLYGGALSNSYSANQVTSRGTRGGLIGQATSAASVTSSYWDTVVSGLTTSAGGTGRTTAEMQETLLYPVIYQGWDFTNIWLPPVAGSYPKLR